MLILITTSNVDSGQCYVLSAIVVKYWCLTEFYASPPYAICETPTATGPNPTFNMEKFCPSSLAYYTYPYRCLSA